jgi:hypothetical protein
VSSSLSDFECCPGCGESFQGPQIPQEYIDKGYYGEGARYYSTKLGIEVRGAYDGVLIWKCEVCNHMWPRFSYEQWGNLHEKALNIISEWEKK